MGICLLHPGKKKFIGSHRNKHTTCDLCLQSHKAQPPEREQFPSSIVGDNNNNSPNSKTQNENVTTPRFSRLTRGPNFVKQRGRDQRS